MHKWILLLLLVGLVGCDVEAKKTSKWWPERSEQGPVEKFLAKVKPLAESDVPPTPELFPPAPVPVPVIEESAPHHFWIFPLFPLFTVGSVWFWLLCAASLIYLLFLIDNDCYGRGSLLVGSVLLTLFVFGDFNLFKWLIQYPIHALVFVISWGIIGGLYAILRWYSFVVWTKHEYKEKRDAFLRSKGITDDKVPDELKNDWLLTVLGLNPDSYGDSSTYYNQKFADVMAEISNIFNASGSAEALDSFERQIRNVNTHYTTPLIVNPQYKNYKHTIITWIEFWPASGFWWAVEGLVKNLGLRIYYGISTFLQRITDYVWRDVKDDFVR